MYHCIIPFDNKSLSTEKKVNPKSIALTPSQIMNLTSEGRATSMHQSDGCLYYPDMPLDVMPLEFTRGLDENDAWEASQKAGKKLREFVQKKQNQSSKSIEHE